MRTPLAWSSSLRRLEEPSPIPFRPLTPYVTLGHHRIGSKPTGSYRPTRSLRAAEPGFTRKARIVPPPSPRGGANPPVREDGGTTQDAFCRIAVLRACAHQPGIPSVLTQCLAAPDKVDRFSLRLTALSTTCTPVRSGKCLYTRLCSASASRVSPRGFSPARSRAPFQGSPPPAPAVRWILRATSPSCGSPCGCHGARQRCVRPTSASHCFDYEYPTLRALPASLRGLRLAHDLELAPVAKRPVGLAFHDA
jgi:hypothetical protein